MHGFSGTGKDFHCIISRKFIHQEFLDSLFFALSRVNIFDPPRFHLLQSSFLLFFLSSVDVCVSVRDLQPGFFVRYTDSSSCLFCFDEAENEPSTFSREIQMDAPHRSCITCSHASELFGKESFTKWEQTWAPWEQTWTSCRINESILVRGLVVFENLHETWRFQY